MFKKTVRREGELPVYYTKQLLRKNRCKFIQKELFTQLFTALRQNPEQIDSVINILFAKINRSWLRSIQTIYVINFTINKVPSFLDKLATRWTPAVYSVDGDVFGKKYKFLSHLVHTHGIYIEKRIQSRQLLGADSYHPDYIKNLVQKENNRTIIKHLASYIDFVKAINEIRSEDKYITCYFAYLILISDVITYCIAIEVLAQMVLDNTKDKNIGALKLYSMFFKEFVKHAQSACDYFDSTCSLKTKSLNLKTRIDSIVSITKEIDTIVINVKSIPFMSDEGDYASILQTKNEFLDGSLFDNEESRSKVTKRLSEARKNHVDIDEDDEDCKIYESTLNLMKMKQEAEGKRRKNKDGYDTVTLNGNMEDDPNFQDFTRISTPLTKTNSLRQGGVNDWDLNSHANPREFNEDLFEGQTQMQYMERGFNNLSLNDPNSRDPRFDSFISQQQQQKQQQQSRNFQSVNQGISQSDGRSPWDFDHSSNAKRMEQYNKGSKQKSNSSARKIPSGRTSLGISKGFHQNDSHGFDRNDWNDQKFPHDQSSSKFSPRMGHTRSNMNQSQFMGSRKSLETIMESNSPPQMDMPDKQWNDSHMISSQYPQNSMNQIPNFNRISPNKHSDNLNQQPWNPASKTRYCDDSHDEFGFVPQNQSDDPRFFDGQGISTDFSRQQHQIPTDSTRKTNSDGKKANISRQASRESHETLNHKSSDLKFDLFKKEMFKEDFHQINPTKTLTSYPETQYQSEPEQLKWSPSMGRYNPSMKSEHFDAFSSGFISNPQMPYEGSISRDPFAGSDTRFGPNTGNDSFDVSPGRHFNDTRSNFPNNFEDSNNGTQFLDQRKQPYMDGKYQRRQ